MNRTLDELRNSLPGKIFLRLGDAQTKQAFAEDANAEGYRFGETQPTREALESIVALKYGKQLAYVGSVGRIAFQCNGGDNAKGTFHRIDYAKYKRGDKDFYFHPAPNLRMEGKTVKTAYHGAIAIIGENCGQAESFFSAAAKNAASPDAEAALLDLLEDKYGVLVCYDD